MGKPLVSFRNRGIDLAAWEFKNNQVSFTLRKTYKNKDTQQWQETKTYFLDDLRNLRTLLDEALSWHDQSSGPAGPGAEKIKSAPEPAITSTLDDDDIPF